MGNKVKGVTENNICVNSTVSFHNQTLQSPLSEIRPLMKAKRKKVTRPPPKVATRLTLDSFLEWISASASLEVESGQDTECEVLMLPWLREPAWKRFCHSAPNRTFLTESHVEPVFNQILEWWRQQPHFYMVCCYVFVCVIWCEFCLKLSYPILKLWDLSWVLFFIWVKQTSRFMDNINDTDLNYVLHFQRFIYFLRSKNSRLSFTLS